MSLDSIVSIMEKAPLGLSPVLLFLLVLLYLDSWKLVDFFTVLEMLLIGGLLAIISYVVNAATMSWLHLDFATYGRYHAPVFEECLKASILVYLFIRNRIGFMVDAAIIGFAIGAGFGVVENIIYLHEFPHANIGVWIARGFGTALMHGGTTAIFGVLAQSLTDRRSTFNPLFYLPGLLIAILIHSDFNNAADAPLIAIAIALILLPLTLFLAFAKSEHAIHKWLFTDFESHEHLLQAIESGEFEHSEAGRFILDLKGKFGDVAVAAVFAFIRLHTELVLRFDKLEMAREKGEKTFLYSRRLGEEF